MNYNIPEYWSIFYTLDKFDYRATGETCNALIGKDQFVCMNCFFLGKGLTSGCSLRHTESTYTNFVKNDLQTLLPQAKNQYPEYFI